MHRCVAWRVMANRTVIEAQTIGTRAVLSRGKSAGAPGLISTARGLGCLPREQDGSGMAGMP